MARFPARYVASIAALSLAGFAALAVAVEAGGPVVEIDERLARWVATELPVTVEWAARPPSWLGGWIGITVLTVAASVVSVRGRAWLDLWFLLAAVLGSQLAVALLKQWFDRPRPGVGAAVALPSSASFPSGHAASGVACLGAVAVLAAERLPSRRARRWLWGVTATLGLGVGLSRIALGVHYASDVVAGWCFGLAWLAGCLLLRDVASRRGRRAPRQ